MSGNTTIEQSQYPEWLTILCQKCQESTIADVARQIGYSRTAVSLALSGKYEGGTGNIEAAVMGAFTGTVHCPYLGCDITQAACGDHQSQFMPTSDPNALRHWMACRSGCPHSNHSIDEDKDYA